MSWTGEVDCLCRQCQERVMVPVGSDAAIAQCSECQTALLQHTTDGFSAQGALDQCACCGCAHLYQQKDFNRKLGVLLLVLGFALAPWTYGISILVLTLIDFFLYKKVGLVACCYECGAVYRDFAQVAEVPEFKLQLFDYYKSVKNTPLRAE